MSTAPDGGPGLAETSALGKNMLTVRRERALYCHRLSSCLVRTGGGDMTSTENWVDIAEVATHLQVTKDSIYRWVDSKKLSSSPCWSTPKIQAV